MVCKINRDPVYELIAYSNCKAKVVVRTNCQFKSKFYEHLHNYNFVLNQYLPKGEKSGYEGLFGALPTK